MTYPDGNTLTISPTGITHSAGMGSTRYAQGRITRISDPAGREIVYGYDGNGDLISVTDRENNITRFEYLNVPNITHYLTRILDPRGIQGLRTEYDASGRVVRQIDASGNPVQMTHDVASRRETIRDRLNNRVLSVRGY